MAAHKSDTELFCYAILFNNVWKKIYTNKPYYKLNNEKFLKENAKAVVNLLTWFDANSRPPIVDLDIKYIPECKGEIKLAIPPKDFLILLPDSSKSLIKKSNQVFKRKLHININPN